MRKITASWVLSFALLPGCFTDKHQYSTDIAAFRNLIDPPMRIQSIRWEMFNTPEHALSVPGPTDYVTLIAQIEPSARTDEVAESSPGAEVWIAPNAARPWLDDEYRTFLSMYQDKPIGLANSVSCHRLQAKLNRAKEVVEGFICKGQASTLLYLTLLDRTHD
jgi:hypothetical protein